MKILDIYDLDKLVQVRVVEESETDDYYWKGSKKSGHWLFGYFYTKEGFYTHVDEVFKNGPTAIEKIPKRYIIDGTNVRKSGYIKLSFVNRTDVVFYESVENDYPKLKKEILEYMEHLDDILEDEWTK